MIKNEEDRTAVHAARKKNAQGGLTVDTVEPL
jgi:hypothetical protein